MGTKKKKNKII